MFFCLNAINDKEPPIIFTLFQPISTKKKNTNSNFENRHLQGHPNNMGFCVLNVQSSWWQHLQEGLLELIIKLKSQSATIRNANFFRNFYILNIQQVGNRNTQTGHQKLLSTFDETQYKVFATRYRHKATSCLSRNTNAIHWRLDNLKSFWV